MPKKIAIMLFFILVPCLYNQRVLAMQRRQEQLPSERLPLATRALLFGGRDWYDLVATQPKRVVYGVGSLAVAGLATAWLGFGAIGFIVGHHPQICETNPHTGIAECHMDMMYGPMTKMFLAPAACGYALSAVLAKKAYKGY